MLIVGPAAGLCAYAETRLCSDGSGGSGGADGGSSTPSTSPQDFLNTASELLFPKSRFFFSICGIYMFTGGTVFQPESKHCSDTFTLAHANKFYCNTLEIHGNHTLKVIESLKRRDVLGMHNHVCIMLLSVETTDQLCIKFIFSSATTQ